MMIFQPFSAMVLLRMSLKYEVYNGTVDCKISLKGLLVSLVHARKVYY